MRHPRTALTMPTRPQDSRLKPNGFDLLYLTTTSRWTIAHPKAERGRDVKKVTTAPGSNFVFGGGFFFSPPSRPVLHKEISGAPHDRHEAIMSSAIPPPKKQKKKKFPTSFCVSVPGSQYVQSAQCPSCSLSLPISFLIKRKCRHNFLQENFQ